MLLFLYRFRKDPRKFLVHLDEMGPLFPLGATFAAEWSLMATFCVEHPLKRPLNANEHLYVAENMLQYPYATTNIKRVDNLFYPREQGIYFVANDATITELRALGSYKI